MSFLRKHSVELVCSTCNVSNWTQIESPNQNKDRWKCEKCGVCTFECEKMDEAGYEKMAEEIKAELIREQSKQDVGWVWKLD